MSWKTIIFGPGPNEKPSGELPIFLADVTPIRHLPARPAAFLGMLLIGRFKLRLAIMALLAMVMGCGDSIAPYMFGNLLNALTAALQKGAGLETLLRPFSLLVAAWSASHLSQRAYEITDAFTSPRFRARAQHLMFGYLLGHSPRYFQDNFAGKLGQKIKNAGHSCVPLVNIFSFEMMRLLVLITIAGSLMWRQNPDYALVLGSWAILHLAVSIWLASKIIVFSKLFSDEVSTSSGKMIDVITNSDVVRAFSRAGQERRYIAGFLRAEQARSQRLRWFHVAMNGVQSLGILAMLSLLVWLAAHDVLRGRLTLGGFTMIFMLTGMLASVVQNLAWRTLEFFENYGTLAEALELISERHEIVDAPGAKPLVVAAGDIRFEHVRFAFPDGNAVFEDLNVAIRPGERIGLVGHSGAGKSTLVKLLRRQFEPQAGRILIDGQNIADVTWDSLNEAIAEVPQSPGIFHRPVRENISYAKPHADQDQIEQAAIQAHAHEFIARRPTGYETIVGEQGIKLSGGERQRVAIARALVKDAHILVLDEATSALDSESEHLIQDALWRLMEGRTVIAIAHRLSTIRGMDRILYLDRGRIVEEGSHTALLAQRGAYARLWERQMGGFLAAE